MHGFPFCSMGRLWTSCLYRNCLPLLFERFSYAVALTAIQGLEPWSTCANVSYLCCLDIRRDDVACVISGMRSPTELQTLYFIYVGWVSSWLLLHNHICNSHLFGSLHLAEGGTRAGHVFRLCRYYFIMFVRFILCSAGNHAVSDFITKTTNNLFLL